MAASPASDAAAVSPSTPRACSHSVEPPDFERPRRLGGLPPLNVYVVTLNALTSAGESEGALTVRVTVSDVLERGCQRRAGGHGCFHHASLPPHRHA